MTNPFYDDVDDAFRGVRVRVHTTEHTYEGWCGRWHYNEHGVIIHDTERDDGEELGAKGAAIVLGVAVGEYPSLEAAVDRTVDTETRYEPRPDTIDAYDELYDLFADIREGMDPLWTRRASAYWEGVSPLMSD